MSLVEHYLAEMRRISKDAARTDYVMPLWLPFLPTILFAVGVLLIAVSILGGIAAVLASIALLILILLVGGVINIYVLYKWISRRNNHFRRTAGLYETLVSALESMGVSDPEVVQIKSRVQEMKYEERERSAVLWIVISFLFSLVLFYVYHFLNKDFREHELREAAIYENLSRILERRGVLAPRFEPRVPDRSTVLYVVLTIMTLGFFLFYWVYTMARDPNEHFKIHRTVEDGLIKSLEDLARALARPRA